MIGKPLSIRRRHSGQATVEFALVLTVLILMIYGILEVSRLIFINAEIDNAAREAARYASLVDVSHDDLVALVDSKLVLVDDGAVTVEPLVYLPGGTRCSFCQVQVTVNYQWNTLVPILQLGPLLLHSTSTVIIESQ